MSKVNSFSIIYVPVLELLSIRTVLVGVYTVDITMTLK
jgi:hypothetical protein